MHFLIVVVAKLFVYLFIFILNVEEVDIYNWLGFYSLHVHLI